MQGPLDTGGIYVTPIDRHIGNRLKKLREERGLSHYNVDIRVGQPVGTCKLLEQGAAFFGPSHLLALAQMFDVDPSYFFDGLPINDNTLPKETKDLIKAFDHIEDPDLRKTIIGLVKAVTD